MTINAEKNGEETEGNNQKMSTTRRPINNPLAFCIFAQGRTGISHNSGDTSLKAL